MKNVYIRVIDRFDVTIYKGGASILPRGEKENVLLAVLACSDDMKKTRKYLCETLWSNCDEETARASLHQTLGRIRQRHPVFREILKATEVHVALDSRSIDVDFNPRDENKNTSAADRAQLPDSIVQPDPAFVNWLDRLRTGVDISTLSAATDPESDPNLNRSDRVQVSNSWLNITLTNPVIDTKVSTDSLQATNWALDNILYWTNSLEFVRVYDQRALPTPQSDFLSISDSSYLVSVSVYIVDGNQQVFVKMVDALTGRLHWSSSKTGKNSITFESSVSDIVVQFIDYLIQLAEECDKELVMERMPSRIGVRALSAILNPGCASIEDIDNCLKWGLERDPSGLKYAVSALLEALRFGEQLEPMAKQNHERINQLLSLALRHSPTNATVLAIVGHVYGYVLGNIKRALKMTRYSIELQPNNPLSHVFHSLALHYNNSDREALDHAIIAHRLGGHSVSRTLLNSVAGSMYVVAGEMHLATSHAEDALEASPTFRPVLNTLLITYSQAGDSQRAEGILESLRNQDPRFSYSSVKSREYPVKNISYRKKLCSTVLHLRSS